MKARSSALRLMLEWNGVVLWGQRGHQSSEERSWGGKSYRRTFPSSWEWQGNSRGKKWVVMTCCAKDSKMEWLLPRISPTPSQKNRSAKKHKYARNTLFLHPAPKYKASMYKILNHAVILHNIVVLFCILINKNFKYFWKLSYGLVDYSKGKENF